MIPIYRLSTPLTRAWAINREARHKLAAWLAHRYKRTGVSVCTDTLLVVATVNPLGQIKFATPPFMKIERHQCANNPTWRECECRKWFDPETRAAWGQRDTPAHRRSVEFRHTSPRSFGPCNRRRRDELDQRLEAGSFQLPRSMVTSRRSRSTRRSLPRCWRDRLHGCASRLVPTASERKVTKTIDTDLQV